MSVTGIGICRNVDSRANEVAIDIGHKRLLDASRLDADGGSSLKANAFCRGIVVVNMQSEIDAEPIERNGSARAL